MCNPSLRIVCYLSCRFEPVGKLSAVKESNIHVRFEGIDVGKCSVTDTCGRMTIVQYLAHIFAASAHDYEPTFRELS